MSGCRSANQEVIDANLWPKKDYWEDGSSAGHVRTVVSDELKLSDNLDHKDKTVTKDGCIAPVQFTFHELAAATKNFCTNCFMGEGDFGNVYRGHLERTGQVVFVEQLCGNFDQGVIDFSMEVLKLSLYRHENLVNLIGFCADRGHHLLVREFMTLTSLEHHLHYLLPNQEPLDWNTRMKIALGVAKGLEYLHNTANPPVVYGDLKPSNILLDQRHGYHPKLSNLKLGKHTPFDNITSHSSYQAAITYTYCDPEGPLSFHSDVYSFGLVFLELITGRKPIDYNRPPQERYLVYWARPLLKEMRNYRKMADPMLQGRYPPKRLKQALAIASMCMHEAIAKRPNIHSVVAALIDVASQTSAHPEPKTVTDDVVASI